MDIDSLRLDKFCAATGWTDKAIRRMIEKGEWIDGREYSRTPSNRILISITGYEAWVSHYRKAVPRTLQYR